MNATTPKAAKANTPSSKSDEVSMEDLTRQLNTLKDDMAQLTSALGSYGQSVATGARDSAKERASDLRDAGVDRARQTQQQAEEFIRTQPTTALGIAAGVGFLVGLVTARR